MSEILSENCRHVYTPCCRVIYMNKTSTRYHVTYTMNNGRTGGRITVEAADKAAAAIEAPRALVRFAKGYEAKWGVAYCHRGDQHDAYVVTGVRKAPAKR